METVKEEKPKAMLPDQCAWCASSRWESLHSEYRGCVYCRQSSESPLKDFKSWPKEDRELFQEWLKLRNERDAWRKANFHSPKPFPREARYQQLSQKD